MGGDVFGESLAVKVERIARDDANRVLRGQTFGRLGHTITQRGIPVPVVDRHATDPRTLVTEHSRQPTRCRVIRLTGQEELTALDVLERIPYQVRVLIAECMQIFRSCCRLGLIEEHAQQTPSAAHGRRSADPRLSGELDEELLRTRLDARVEADDALFPMLVKSDHEIREPATAGLQESDAEAGMALQCPVKDQLRQRHLLHGTIRKDMDESEAVELIRGAPRQLHAASPVDRHRHIQAHRLIEKWREIRVREMSRDPNLGKRLGCLWVRLREIRRHTDRHHPQLGHAAPQLEDRLLRIADRQHAHRMQTLPIGRAIGREVVVESATKNDGELRIDQSRKRQRDRAEDHLVVDALAVHMLEPDAIEQPADGGLGVVGTEGPLAVALGLEKIALPEGPGGVPVDDPKALLAEAVANEGDPLPVLAGDEVEEDHRVFALVTVGIDDGKAAVHGCPLLCLQGISGTGNSA